MRAQQSRPAHALSMGFVLSSFVLAPAALAQSDPARTADGSEQTRAEAQAARALKRVLQLRGGTTLRAIARRDGEAWKYKSGGAWRTIPAGAVESAHLEKELVNELRKRAREVAEDDVAGRVELARWSLGAGLLEEGLEHLDTVLVANPDQKEARSLALENMFRFRVPEVTEPARGSESDENYAKAFAKACDTLIRWSASTGPAVREMAVHRMGSLHDRDALRSTLVRALHSTSVAQRGVAAHALRRLFAGQEVKPLILRAVLDTSDDVRRQSSLALRDVNEPGLAVPVVRVMQSSSSTKVRAQAAQALGEMGYGATVEPLVSHLATMQSRTAHGVPHSNIFVGKQFAFIQDFDVEVAQFQAVADPQINVLIEGQVTDAGVQSIGHAYFAAETRAVKTALGQLTGADPGRQTRDWLRWWEENKNDWRSADLSRPAEDGAR